MQQAFGISDMSPPDNWDEALGRVWAALNRDAEIPAMDELYRALAPKRSLKDAKRLALSFDTSSLYRLGRGQAGADTLDYLRAQRVHPVVVPGQTLQEVWNNQVVGLRPLGRALQTRFGELESEAARLDHRFGDTGEKARDAIAALIDEYEDVFDEAAEATFRATIDVFRQSASVPFVPRLEFRQLAQVRHETKTPPGFKDSGHGDFFVWADLLYGLAQLDPDAIDGVVFVTNDTKADWSRSGVAHPLLAAEAAAVVPRPFELWTVEQLNKFVRAQG